MLIWTGTATVTNGDATVVVDTGAALTAEVVAYGAMVVLDGVVYFAGSLTDTTTLELTRVYAGVTGTVDMEIWPVSQDTTNLVNLAQIVARTQAQINILDKNSQGLFFNMKGVTGAADPGPGFIAFDDDDATLVNEAYVDALDANGRAVSELVGLWEAGTTVVIRSLTTTAYRAYTVATNADQTGWTSLALTYVGHDGVLADNEALSISWSRAAAGLEINATGNFADRDLYDDAPAGFVFLSADGDGDEITVACLFRKNSATTGDWGPAVPFQGPKGDRGWSPVFAVVNDSARRVLRLVDYVGGEGTKPTVGINQYVSAGGLTSTIGSATDIRGPQGLSAYEVAVVNGFAGSQAEWLASLVGASAYQVAVANGFVGDQAAWLASLNGTDGTDPGALFNWDDGTADADPGAGNMRADSADLSAAAFLYVSKTGRTGDDLEAFLLGIGTSTNTIKGHVTLTSSGGNAQAIVRVIGLTDATGYVKIGLQASTHAGAIGFVDATPVSLQFSLAGNQGAADEVSMASAINGSPEVTDPAAATKFAITDPDNGDLLSWISFESLGNAIKPRALVDAKTTNYTVLVSDLGKNLNVDASAANRTITLPPAATAGNGFEIGIRKSDSSTNTVTIDGDGAETINGSATLVLRSQRESVRLVSNGTAWQVVATSGVTDGDKGGVVVSDGGTVWTVPALAVVGLELAEDRTYGPVSLGPEGIYDGLNTTTFVDMAGATNVDSNTAGEIRPTLVIDQDSSGVMYTTAAQPNFTVGDRSWKLDNGKTVIKLGAALDVAETITLKIALRVAAGSYNIVVSQSFAHPGGGWADVTLSSPYAVPGTGDYHVAVYQTSGGVAKFDKCGSQPRFIYTGNASGSGVTFTEAASSDVSTVRAIYSETIGDMEVESTDIALAAQPREGTLYAILDPETAVLNTDIIFGLSRDGGNNYATAAVSQVHERPDGTLLVSSGAVDLSGQPAGTDGRWRITTDNGVRPAIKAVGTRWDA